MRALEAEHRILILDEPTTSLGAPERQRLYAIVDDLRRRGLAIIFISHDLDEILSLCDRVTVMRDGEMVATKHVGEWTKQMLVGAMLGGAELRRTVARKPPAAAPALVVKDWRFRALWKESPSPCTKGKSLGSRD